MINFYFPFPYKWQESLENLANLAVAEREPVLVSAFLELKGCYPVGEAAQQLRQQWASERLVLPVLPVKQLTIDTMEEPVITVTQEEVWVV